jgi:hypothetical protein
MEMLPESPRKIRGAEISKVDGDRFYREICGPQKVGRGRQPFLLGVFSNSHSLGEFEKSSRIGAGNIQLEISASVLEIPPQPAIMGVDKVS